MIEVNVVIQRNETIEIFRFHSSMLLEKWRATTLLGFLRAGLGLSGQKSRYNVIHDQNNIFPFTVIHVTKPMPYACYSKKSC
jgi:hypothetical protein